MEMFDADEQPNILFFKGVFLKTYDIEGMFTTRLMDEIRGEEDPMYDLETEMKEYDSIPDVFTTIDDWPTSTNLECWVCRRKPPNQPRFAPTKITKNGDELVFGVSGVFCTFVCAGAYIDIHCRDKSTWWERHRMLRMLYEKFTGNELRHVVRVEPPTQMVQCGGTIPTAEYYKMLDLAESAMATSV